MRFSKVLLAVFWGVFILNGCSTAPGSPASSGLPGPENRGGNSARNITFVTAAEKPMERLVVVTGTLAAEQDVILGLKVAGRISELPVDLGSSVSKGDVIARLDTTDFELRVAQSEAALQQARVRLGLPPEGTTDDVVLEQVPPVRQARAQMDGAKARLDRAIQLAERGLLAKSDLDATTSAYKVTEAQYADALDEARNRQGILAQRRSELQIARQQLADAVLYAPIGGAVRQRQANVGQYLAAGTPIVTVVQMNPLRLRTEIPEREARSVRLGMQVRVTVEDAAGIHAGKIVRLSPSLDEVSRTLLVETEVSNSDNSLRPGAFARAEIVITSGQRALMVPAESVVTFAGIDRVFTVQEGKASEKRVKTGRRTDAGIEILEGIAAGDQVVLKPGNMTDGEAVAAAPSNSAKGQ